MYNRSLFGSFSYVWISVTATHRVSILGAIVSTFLLAIANGTAGKPPTENNKTLPVTRARDAGEDAIIRILVSHGCEVLRNDDGRATHLAVPSTSQLAPADISTINHLRSLESVMIAKDPASEYLLAMRDLPKLTALGLTGGKSNDDDAQQVAMLGSVKTLMIISTRMTDRGIQRIAAIPSLEELSLTNVVVSEIGAQAIAKSMKVRAVSFLGCGVTSDTFARLCTAPQLERLTIMDARLRDADLTLLRNLPKLHVLELINIGITDDAMTEINRLGAVDELWIGGPKLTEGGILSLKPRTKLKKLTIDGVSVSETTKQELERRFRGSEIRVLGSRDSAIEETTIVESRASITRSTPLSTKHWCMNETTGHFKLTCHWQPSSDPYEYFHERLGLREHADVRVASEWGTGDNDL